MKKQILGLAVVLFMGSAVCMAQDNRGGRPDMSKRIEQMVTDLGLNETQAKEFKAVMEEMRPNRNASGERPSREEMEKKRYGKACFSDRPRQLWHWRRAGCRSVWR